MKTTTTYRVDYKNIEDGRWWLEAEYSDLESAKEAVRLLRIGINRKHSLRIVKKVTTVEYSVEMPETASPRTVWDFLSEFDVCNLSEFNYWGCNLATFSGLKSLDEKDGIQESDRHFVEDGDSNGIYFVDQDGYVYYVCKYTEGNCQKLNDRLKKTRANNLMNTFKRIEFEG